MSARRVKAREKELKTREEIALKLDRHLAKLRLDSGSNKNFRAIDIATIAETSSSVVYRLRVGDVPSPVAAKILDDVEEYLEANRELSLVYDWFWFTEKLRATWPLSYIYDKLGEQEYDAKATKLGWPNAFLWKAELEAEDWREVCRVIATY